jgi:hypothetical protein
MHPGSPAGTESAEFGTVPDGDCRESLGNVCGEYKRPRGSGTTPRESGSSKRLEVRPRPAIKCDINHKVIHSFSFPGALTPWLAGIILHRMNDEMGGSLNLLRDDRIRPRFLAGISRADARGEVVSRPK